MAAIDDFKAEYARQHPQRPEKDLWSDEALVGVELYGKLRKEIAALAAQLSAMKYKNCDE